MRAEVPSTRKPVVQQVVLSTAMVGAAIVYILIGRDPGWQAYLISGLLAVGFLTAALVMWQGSNWIGIVALAVLLASMVWKSERPYSAAVGLALSILSAFKAYHNKRDAEEQAAKAELQPLPAEEPESPEDS